MRTRDRPSPQRLGGPDAQSKSNQTETGALVQLHVVKESQDHKEMVQAPAGFFLRDLVLGGGVFKERFTPLSQKLAPATQRQLQQRTFAGGFGRCFRRSAAKTLNCFGRAGQYQIALLERERRPQPRR